LARSVVARVIYLCFPVNVYLYSYGALYLFFSKMFWWKVHSLLFFLFFLNSGLVLHSICWLAFDQTGNLGNYHASETAPKGAQAFKIQPIEVPEISGDELKEVTDNFGTSSLIGEGSYGRVYYGVLKSGQDASIKKLDASKQPDDEFLSQVSLKS